MLSSRQSERRCRMRSLSRQERESLVARTIQSLPKGAGCALKTLNPEIPFCKQPRPCECCGVEFTPKDTLGLARFCGRSCSAKWRMSQPEHVAKLHTPDVRQKRGRAKAAWLASGSPEAEAEMQRVRLLNPMTNPDVRRRVSQILKEMNHKPSVRGGNGTGLTLPQMILLNALGPTWVAEFALSLGRRRRGYPTHYKLDLANVAMRVCIEVDGPSHYSRKDADAKKDAMLASLGWSVLRFWNRDILIWSDSGMPTDSSISTTLRRNGIQVSR